jgi:hypothetical protein
MSFASALADFNWIKAFLLMTDNNLKKSGMSFSGQENKVKAYIESNL